MKPNQFMMITGIVVGLSAGVTAQMLIEGVTKKHIALLGLLPFAMAFAGAYYGNKVGVQIETKKK